MKLKRFQKTLSDTPARPKEQNPIRRFLQSRRAKYGSVALAFTVTVLLAALMLNVLLTSVSENSPLTVDMSSADFFTLSEASETLIEGVMPEERETIRVRFMMPQDRLKSNEYYNMALECATSYAKRFDNIKVEFLDIVTRPSDVSDYRTLGFDIDSVSVVVDCPAKNRVKTFGIETCFLVKEGETGYYGFDGETQFTAAIMAVCRETTPVVTFTQGHGETVPVQLERMFTTAGYTVRRTNLLKEELDPATEILVISDPQTDFIGLFSDEDNEIDILTEYLNDYRDIMVFLSPDTQELPELDALLRAWGVEVQRGVALRDETASVANTSGATLIADFAGEAYLTDGTYSTFGSALHKTLSEQQSPPMVLVPDAAPVNILYTNTDGADGMRSVDSVLCTSGEAYLVDENGKKQVASYPLLALSTVAGYRDNDQVYSHLLVCGSATFSEVVAAGDSSYGNSEILYTAMTLMGKEAAPQGIALKKLDDTTLSVPEGYAKTALVLSMCILPVVTFALGAAVHLRRRHK